MPTQKKKGKKVLKELVDGAKFIGAVILIIGIIALFYWLDHLRFNF